LDVVVFINFFIKYYIPPMIANAMPVLISKGRPIDFGKKFIDGKRLLGDGKTWEGLVTGLLGGSLASIVVSTYLRQSSFIPISVLASFMALIGDILESFIKRRLGIKRGEPLPILDQLDFAIAATLTYAILGYMKEVALDYIIMALLIILIMHLTTNVIAYLMKLKDRPW